ncbi:flavocytochrome c [Turicimonas muris]|uniref:flavocytochrome c n=1 Tax=Turicimonas muris TaxID=1796652 RepID=UPI002494A22E|nr:flavocytochrome c [Turicimonas muris]
MKALTRRSLFKTGLATALLSGASSATFAQLNAPKKWDETYDVVIVGAGGAGLAAAVEAAENKMTAVVLESQPIIGGSSTLNGGMIAVAGTKEQEKQGLKDSKELYVKDMLKSGYNKGDEAVVKAFVDGALYHYEWLTQKMGMFPDSIAHQGGQTVPRSHHFVSSKILKLMADYAKSHGIKILTRSPALRLVWNQDHSRIAGVEASARGKKIFIEAKKGVLLAAGGFSRNPELIAKYNPPLAHADAIAGLGTKGDGIKMGLSVGADMLDTAYIKATYGFKLNPSTINDMTQVYWSGGIIVNSDAKRFVNEEISYKTIADVALAQKEGKSWIVFDRAILKENYKSNPQGRELWDPIFKDKKIPDYIFEGATLEEAAKKAGLNPQALEATVNAYNKGIEKDNDDFGRKGLVYGQGKPVPIKEGPFYIMPATAALIATYCGLKITPTARVVNVFGEVIPGLWAAGELTGGVHGAGYLSGSAFAKAQAFGRIAVKDMFNSK